MKKFLFSFILSVATFASANADEYTGILVTGNAGQKTYYLFEEQPTIKYQKVDDVMNACLFVTGEESPIVSVPLTDGAKLTVRFDDFVRVTLNNAGFATFSAKNLSFIATEGITAYKALVDGELITLTALEGNIPAGTGVLLYGETAGTKVDLPVTTTGTEADVTDNNLKPTTLSTGKLAEKESNVWVLGDENQFLEYIGAEFIHNRAYLIHDNATSVKSMRMVFNSEVTGIDTIINETPVREGKFIENGNIVIIKNGMKYNVAGQVIK
ncbi:MAG: hypothetical protein MJZ20_05420 [Bacteroidaceae bacterium]|nr:hypothetical protein [Bacteroidaceae bacterium]